MTLTEVQLKWSVILMHRLGLDIFSTLRMKGNVLHRAGAHLKVPGWSLVWNALLTKKLPMFLSRLNEINRGCEKIKITPWLRLCCLGTVALDFRHLAKWLRSNTPETLFYFHTQQAWIVTMISSSVSVLHFPELRFRRKQDYGRKAVLIRVSWRHPKWSSISGTALQPSCTIS